MDDVQIEPMLFEQALIFSDPDGTVGGRQGAVDEFDGWLFGLGVQVKWE